MKKWLCSVLIFSAIHVHAQVKQEFADTSDLLEQVVVKAYENNRKLVDVPAPISVISKAQFERFNNTSLVPALNTTAGVRMEERSPGSYRLNIRGSSLRSPFGVRNVKVYYNNIPYTDPGGNTYFNQLGFYNVGSMEIIKGPGSSLYGAGTGGVILMTSDDPQFKRGGSVDYVNGSFGTNSIHLKLNGGNDVFHSSTNYQYQNSDGYREHTKMERKVLTWDGYAKVGNKGTLRAHFLQGNLYYQTPGALTQAEFNLNPKSARPRVGQTPGAVEAQAAITQQLYLAGFDYSVKWNDHWRSISSMYGAYSKVNNPTTRNYEIRTEPHYGTRNMIEYAGDVNQYKIKLQGGIEAQQQFTSSKVYKNVQGNPDTLRTDDEVVNNQTFVFGQAIVDLPGGWTVTAGASLNVLKIKFNRLSLPPSMQKKTFNNEVAPRFAILKKVLPGISVYGTVAKGFSPPTTAELLPSTGVITTALQAEHGWNIEGGVKGSLINAKIFFDVSVYRFGLENTIAQRRDITGGDYFVNAGRTKQNGLEAFVSYRLYENPVTVISRISLLGAYTFSNFHYANFEKIGSDTALLSGKRLPSVAKNYFSGGADIMSRLGFYANISYFYSDPMPVNDANTVYASSYNLLDARLGFRKTFNEKMYADVFAAADNLFDVKYSLGNDINAAGGRYFNAAPGRNYSVGVSVRYNW